MPNPNGTASSLVPAEPGNVRALKHGAYSDRFMDGRVGEIVTELMALPHVRTIDLPAAREIAHLTVLAERIDAALADGRVESKRGQLRALVDQRRRLSAQLERWHAEFGMTPRSRATWAGRSTLAAEIRRIMESDGDE
jgi:hypothetical protein